MDHNGGLRFNETIPYNEQMLATITNTNIDTVSKAMELFRSLGMVEILDDQTIYMNEVSKMLGAETYWAEKNVNNVKKQSLIYLKHLKLDIVQVKSKLSKQCPR